MRIMIVGGMGELGDELARCCWSAGHDALPLSRNACDVQNGDACLQTVKVWPPDVIVNCAAYHQVDAAEQGEGAVEAYRVNAYGAANLAVAAQEAKAHMMFISSDYVFDGLAGRPYIETDEPNPVNIYGRSKRAGELAVSSVSVPWTVVRTAALFGGHGQSQKGGDFFRRLVSRWRNGERISMTEGVTTSLTYVPDLAAALLRLIDSKETGYWHLVNEGHMPWDLLATVALEIVNGSPVAVSLLSQEAQRARGAAPRPSYSALRSARGEKARLPHFMDRLPAYLRTLGKGVA